MAGHSKWANIKRRKEKVDAQRGRTFTRVAREIMVAARQGGGDPANNVRLRLAVERARSVNMPMESIERAIKRGTGELGAGALEEIVYEGYGPGGTAILLRAMTDNRNRTASELRYLFSRHGGNLGEAGCVAWMFMPRGLIRVEGDGADEETVTLVAADAGALDVEADQVGRGAPAGDGQGAREGGFTVWTEPESLDRVRQALEAAGQPVTRAEVVQVPQATLSLAEDDARRALDLIEALEEHDDVQEVFTNLDLSEEVLERLGA